MVFSRRRKLPPFRLKLDGGEIEFRNEVKYLGVTLDSKLHWTPHITEKISNTKKYLAKIAHITVNNWGPKPRLMRWAFLGIVRPMLCYGTMIWGHRAPERIAKLRRINRMAMNTFASFPKSTPTAALEVMLDVMPLHLFCVQEALLARLRLNSVLEFGWDGKSHTKNHARSHMKFLADTLDEYNISPNENDRCSQVLWSEGYKINWESFSGEAKHRQPTQYNVYTDGSKYNGQTGAGLAIYKGGNELRGEWFRLPDYATVFQAEVAAIERAASELTNMRGNDVKYVKIFVDWQAAIAALGNPKVTSHAVAGAVRALNTLAQNANSVTLTWIPAHKGHAGNERADELAKKGTAEDDPERTLRILRPQASTKAEIKAKTYARWGREWEELKIASHSKSFYSGPNARKARFVYKLARLELGRLVRIITGHNNLNFFQAKLGLTRSPLCRFCNEGNETITHLMRSCPVFTELCREVFLDDLPMADMKWSVRNLLHFSYHPRINQAFEGSWERGGAGDDENGNLNVTLGLEWLEGADNDDNNNQGPTMGEL